MMTLLKFNNEQTIHLDLPVFFMISSEIRLDCLRNGCVCDPASRSIIVKSSKLTAELDVDILNGSLTQFGDILPELSDKQAAAVEASIVVPSRLCDERFTPIPSFAVYVLSSLAIVFL